MTDLKFVYVSYIASTKEKIWEALTTPEITKTFWMGAYQKSDWKVGSPWAIVMKDEIEWDNGKILEIDPPSKLVVSWTHRKYKNLEEIGQTKCTFDLADAAETVKLTITHEIPTGGEAFLDAVSGGWPQLLSSLKSLLETGKVLNLS